MNRETSRYYLYPPVDVVEERAEDVFNTLRCTTTQDIWRSKLEEQVLSGPIEAKAMERAAICFVNEAVLDLDPNRYKVAWALSYVDSGNLPVDTRLQLGLAPKVKPLKGKTNKVKEAEPTLFRPLTNRSMSEFDFSYLCNWSEYYLASALRNEVDCPVLHFFLPCLYGKAREFVSGLCHQTTENNGTVFVEGVWYFLKDGTRAKEIQEYGQGHDGAEYHLKTDSGRKNNPEATGIQKGYVVSWTNFGGVWEPVRGFASFDKNTCMPDYREIELRAFLAGQLNPFDLFRFHEVTLDAKP